MPGNQKVSAVAFDEWPTAPDSYVVGHQRAEHVADCAGECHTQHRELSRGNEIAGEGHDDFARQWNTGAFDRHGDHDTRIAEGRNRGDDKPAELLYQPLYH